MNKLNTFFDHIYCINLDKRTDRWKLMNDYFTKNGITVTRFSAVDGTKIDVSHLDHKKLKDKGLGAVGCSMSHLNIIKDAKENGYDKILIFEDDCIFEPNFIDIAYDVLMDLPDNWHMIYLAGMKRDAVTDITDKLQQCTGITTTHCYGVHSSLYDTLIDTILTTTYAVDRLYQVEIHPKYNCYISNKQLVFQTAGYSDVTFNNESNRFSKHA